MALSEAELKEIYPDHPHIHLTPGGEEARKLGCNCFGHRPGMRVRFVSEDCPLGHGKRGWGLGPPRPGTPYANEVRLANKIAQLEFVDSVYGWIGRGRKRRR